MNLEREICLWHKLFVTICDNFRNRILTFLTIERANFDRVQFNSSPFSTTMPAVPCKNVSQKDEKPHTARPISVKPQYQHAKI